MSSTARTIYFVLYTPPGARKKPLKSRFRMTPEDAAKRYAGMQYELVEAGKIDIPDGLDISSNSTSAFLRDQR
ncbi:hypothetical protein [Janthinobacterium lividum]|uniref:hypothetical protein n=1 Tax=Janthinobacterium lividum TaxID=29581 RepID=UPI0011131BE5|nr:hypothetical protein [Janthinobacterium lividum]MCC7713393.1 hypothetical protein [Janthinobacterium lividum]WQE26458.1 hypothetical protein U0004_15785 [Janthinobacterium lividum]